MRIFVAVYILFVFLLVNASKIDSDEERYNMYIDILHNCTEENGITVEMYSYASKTNNTGGAYDKSKCVDACMFKLLKIMRDDGTIDMEMALEHLLSGQPGVQREIMQKNIEDCDFDDENHCESAHKLMTCSLGYY